MLDERGRIAVTRKYLFDLTQGYIYGLFALNPFCIQKVDLKEVEDVEVVISDIKGYITTSVICRTIWKSGKSDIYIQRHRKYHPLTWGGRGGFGL